MIVRQANVTKLSVKSRRQHLVNGSIIDIDVWHVSYQHVVNTLGVDVSMEAPLSMAAWTIDNTSAPRAGMIRAFFERYPVMMSTMI